MKSWEIQKAFGLENLVHAERPDPQPGPRQVLVGMRAVSLNFRDLLMVRGQYYPKQPLPLIPLSDGVGEVLKVGDGVTRVKAGQRVCPIFCQRWIAGPPTKAKLLSALGGPLDGTLVERMILDEEGVVPTPDHLSDEEAATLTCAAVTAWSAVVEQGGLRAGDTLAVLGTGGVSVFALQFAKMLGARVIVTSSSDGKLERAKSLGADELVNYKTTPDWDRKVKDLTGGVGADHVLEVGGGGTFPRSVRAVRVGGHISLIGVLSGATTEVNLAPILMQNIRVQGVLVGNRETFESMNRAVEQHRLRPVLDRIFPFDEARAAFEHMAGQGHFGKIAIRMG
jgi:NADPH:quinone reductase-like Zn-dependent oxidoreductase